MTEASLEGYAPSTSRLLNETYTSDANHVYYRDSPMSGMDIASFICGYGFVAAQSYEGGTSEGR